MLHSIVRVLDDENGATLVEYALIVSLIAVACIGVVTALGTQIQTAFNTIGSNVGNA